LFAALLPPAEVLDEVERAIAPHVGAWPGLRWPERATWHLTLAFFGEVPEPVLPDLEVRLARAAARHEVEALSFEGAGAFSSARRARVLWAGVREHVLELESGSRSPLVRLAESVAAGARRAGAGQTDTKRFHPHLTLARARLEMDLRPLVESLSTFRGSTWRADAVHLVRSHQGPPVRYESLAAWALTPPRGD
jgi:2'-5' RNA ligase